MSCGCTNTCGCSNCVPAPATCCTPTVDSVTYSYENANLVGIGFFDNETNNLVQFRGIASNSLAFTLALDAPNKVIVADFDSALLIADIPDATTAQRGILETATDAEAIAKAANNKIVTPSNFAAMGATTTFAGFAELSTDAEALAGVSTSVVLTPSNLQYVLDNSTVATTVWADAATRAGATPAFQGQIGTQQDTNAVWVASGTTAGDFDVPVFTANTTTTLSATTTLDIGGTTFQVSNGFFYVDGYASFYGNRIDFGQLGQQQIVDFYDADVRIFSTSIPANSVVITGISNGLLSSALINTFLSTANVQTGYTTFSNPSTIRTCDTATVTLQQLAQIVGTLVEDLKSVLLPAT